MTKEEALKELTIAKLIQHCLNECILNKGNKRGYEHYIFMQLLKEAYDRQIEDYIIDYSLIVKE